MIGMVSLNINKNRWFMIKVFILIIIKLRISFWMVVFCCLGFRLVKKLFIIKLFFKGFIMGNKVIKEEENIISRLFSDIVFVFFKIFY